MSEDRRQPPWVQIVAAAMVAAAGGSLGTTELLYRVSAQADERAKWEDEARATLTGRITKMEDEVRALRDMVIRCEEGRR